jgi:hypothetical protein
MAKVQRLVANDLSPKLDIPCVGCSTSLPSAVVNGIAIGLLVAKLTSFARF